MTSLVNKRISYSGVVLDDMAQNRLKNRFRHRIPEDWNLICHHMTICLGPLPEELKSMIGHPVKLKCVSFAMNDLVAAVEVIVPAELRSFVKNDFPHITVAVNKIAGGKPVMSNDLLKTKAKEIEDSTPNSPVGAGIFAPFEILGFVTEVPFS